MTVAPACFLRLCSDGTKDRDPTEVIAAAAWENRSYQAPKGLSALRVSGPRLGDAGSQGRWGKSEWMSLSRCRLGAARSNRRRGRSLAGAASRSAGGGWAGSVV